MRHAVAGVVVVVVAAGGWLADLTVAQAHTIEPMAVVHISDSSVDPPQLNIQQGDTVVFENAGQNVHWPASNIHPTHEVYPEFDSQKPLPPGEQWQFTFDRPGQWRWHDHLDPKLTGEIRVEQRNNVAPPTSSEADATADVSSVLIDAWARFMKLYWQLWPAHLSARLQRVDMLEAANDEDRLRFWLRVLGGTGAMEEILTDAGGGSVIDCHQPAHRAGRAAYKLEGVAVFGEGDASCHSGFYHGAMEALLAEHGTDGLAARIDSVCAEFATSFGRFECLHGVGHGVLVYQDFDLPRALDVCDELANTYAATSCYGGVFMENIVTGQGAGAVPGHATDWVSDDPHFPCNVQSDKNERPYHCYQMQTSWMLTLHNFDFSRVAADCLQAPADMRPVCFKSLGRDAAGHTLREVHRTAALCGLVPREADYYDQCIIGALNVIVDFWGEKLSGQASQLCDTQDGHGQAVCYQTLAGRLPELFTDSAGQRAACNTFSEGFRYLCS